MLIKGLTRLHSVPPANNKPLPPTAGRRSQSTDSYSPEKVKQLTKATKPKKGSQHADVIDRLDFTGVGPSESLAYSSPTIAPGP